MKTLWMSAHVSVPWCIWSWMTSHGSAQSCCTIEPAKPHLPPAVPANRILWTLRRALPVLHSELLADHLRRQLLPPCWRAQTWHAQVSAVFVPLPAATTAHSNLLHVTLQFCTAEQCSVFRVPGTGLFE